MRTSDPRIKDSFKIAKQKKIEYKFIKKHLGSGYHPNTVKIDLENTRRKMTVTGSSVGGGIIEIIKLDNFKLHLKGRAGKYLSLVVCHDKKPKIIKELTRKIKKYGIGVGAIIKDSYDGKTLSIISLEGRRIKLPEVIELEKTTPGVDFVRSLSKLEKQ